MLDVKIYTFLKVAEKRSFTKAANELKLTQPAVSQHISKLEEYYGQKFITIDKRTVSLTPAGEILLQYAKQQFKNEDNLMRQLKKENTKLQIGATLSIADYYIADILRDNHLTDNLDLTIEVNNTQTLLQNIVNGELECAFIEGLFDRNLFHYEELTKEPFLCVVGPNHPLANKEVRFEDLFEYPIILREKGSGTRAILENYLHSNNCSIHSFKKTYDYGSFLLIKEMLQDNLSISFMYQKVALEEVKHGKLKFLSIPNFDLKHSLYFVYLKNTLHHEQVHAIIQKLCNKRLS